MGKGGEIIVLMEAARWEHVRNKNEHSLVLQHSLFCLTYDNCGSDQSLFSDSSGLRIRRLVLRLSPKLL